MTEQSKEPSASIFRRISTFEIHASPETLVVAAAAYFTLLCNSRFWSLLLENQTAGMLTTAKVALSTFVVIAGLHTILLIPFSARRVIKPILAVLFAANAITIYFMDQFGVFVDTSMIRNVFQTDAAETTELLTWKMGRYLLLYALIPFVIVLRTKLTESSLATAARRKGLIAGVAIAATAIGGLSSLKELSSFFRNNRPARYLITPGNYIVSVARVSFSSGRELHKERTPVGQDAALGPTWAANERPLLFVLVVGETARAANFSLNGYARDTNPRLREVPDIVNFSRVLACGTSTADSLPCMFSSFAKSDREIKHAHEYESLLDVVKHAGLDVTWLDNNSGCKGVCDGVESVSFADDHSDPLCASGECFDEILLTGLDSRLATGKSGLLVIHQKGSHGPAYYRRYPREFERFTPACNSDDFDECTQDEIRNAYDNTILYTDFVLSRIIEHLRSASDQWDTAMLYVSDHGESLGERGFYLHGLPYAIAPDTQTHVPMVFWMSSGFAERFSVNREELERLAATKSFSHDNLFHSVLGALEVKTSVYKHALDMFATDRYVASGTEVSTVEAGN